MEMEERQGMEEDEAAVEEDDVVGELHCRLLLPHTAAGGGSEDWLHSIFLITLI